MLRSPISPASICTFARSSSRNAISSADSGPALETFFPGILIPNHQSNTKTAAATTTVMRSVVNKIFEKVGEGTNGISNDRDKSPSRPFVDAASDHALPQVHASFFRKRRAHKLKSRFDITISTKRLGQYSKKFAPRRIIARMSAMK